jgi:hypothetical protein
VTCIKFFALNRGTPAALILYYISQFFFEVDSKQSDDSAQHHSLCDAMKLAFLVIAVGTAIRNLASAWDVSSRCTRRRKLEAFRFDLSEAEQRHNTKISEKNLRGPLDGPLEAYAPRGSDDFIRSDFIKAKRQHDTKISGKNSRAPLDDSLEVDNVHESHVDAIGEAVGQAVDIHRKLQSTAFSLKMYWQEGYCWQEEWDERKWCLECQGSSCGEGDYLVIETCSSSSTQKFVYEGENLKPYTSQDLCWERTGRNAHQLKKCASSSEQIIKGIKFDGNFEMHPNGYSDDCLTNQHHPKSGEIIRGQSCSAARNDKTSLWIMINKDGSNGGDDGDENGGSGNSSDRGREYCDSTTCGLCEGAFYKYDDEIVCETICTNQCHVVTSIRR